MDLNVLMGHAPAKIDEKGRLKIPSNFRKVIEDRYGPECFITSIEGESALVYPLAVWQEFQSRLSKVPRTSVAKTKLLERVNYFGQLSAIDGQGRVLVPTILRNVAGIADDVVVIGNQDHLIVWNEERIQRRLSESPLTAEDFKELELHGVEKRASGRLTMIHDPVLLNESVSFLRPNREDGTLVDATVGLGGHAEALLERYPGARLLAIDRDPDALSRSKERLARFGSRVTFANGRHELLIEILKQQGIESISGLLADLGVSSMQLDDTSRGFSFRFDAPLDMRMGREGRTAADLVNAVDERELAQILRDYGEEPMAKRIARAIVEARATQRIETTTQLADIVRRVKKARQHEIDPATLTFQALRIATNEELVQLETFVHAAVLRLEPAARVAIISFHSLEDRIVKHAFRSLEGICTCPPGLPVCACGANPVIEVLTGRPVTASEDEVKRNPRSRSAKLRVAEKL